ncbi:nucleotidyltransferase family protein [Gleimia hominis]|uniref:nucleotidyltransferase family protein n=1 Tax=Gleimia hominis TaxID=595468 RepID=UPI0013047B8C|nr:nucleotidyltransferase domain-containing protein [Gleimia hominis]WIK64220.1 nucleotidyltransferase domain-containing protein [Gleimia hominis]
MTVLKDNGMYDPAVFGSSARQEDSDQSDLDIVVSTDKPLGFFSLAVVQEKLSNLVGVPVDLVYRQSLLPDVSKQIEQESIAI